MSNAPLKELELLAKGIAKGIIPKGKGKQMMMTLIKGSGGSTENTQQGKGDSLEKGNTMPNGWQ